MQTSNQTSPLADPSAENTLGSLLSAPLFLSVGDLDHGYALDVVQGEERLVDIAIKGRDGFIDLSNTDISVALPAAAGGAIKRSTLGVRIESQPADPRNALFAKHGLVDGEHLQFTLSAPPDLRARGVRARVNSPDSFCVVDAGDDVVPIGAITAPFFVLSDPGIYRLPTAPGSFVLHLQPNITAALAPGIAQPLQVSISRTDGPRIIVKPCGLDVHRQIG